MLCIFFFKNKKYAWRPTTSARSEFPIELIKGDIFYGKDKSIYIPDGRTVQNGWGKIGAIHVAGEYLKQALQVFMLDGFLILRMNFTKQNMTYQINISKRS